MEQYDYPCIEMEVSKLQDLKRIKDSNWRSDGSTATSFTALHIGCSDPSVPSLTLHRCSPSTILYSPDFNYTLNVKTYYSISLTNIDG